MIVRNQVTGYQALQVHILTSFGQDFLSIPYINLTIVYTLLRGDKI